MAICISVLLVSVSVLIQDALLQFVLITVMVIALLWRVLTQIKALQSKIKTLHKEKEKLEDENRVVNMQNEDYELLFHSLDGAVFSIDITQDTVTFSKGMDQIYGYEDKLYHQNRHIWKEVIHEDDVKKVEKHEKNIVSGQSSRVEYRIIHAQTNELRWLSELVTPMKTSNGVLLRVNGHVTDITERKRAEFELKQLAYYDDLTDLPNRKALDRHIEKALARSKRHHYHFIIMFIDLDGFKKVNDTLGHEAGDQLLKEVSVRINECIREEDLVSRIGGDEFVVVFEETTKEEIEMIAKRLLKYVGLPYTINEQEASISLSIGISVYPDDGETKEILLERADQAMYCAKHNGKNDYVMYNPALGELDFKKTSIWERWLDSIQSLVK